MDQSSFISQRSMRWRSLYAHLMSESQEPMRLERIAEARNAILDRAEEILTDPSSEERVALRHALSTLQLLEETVIREAKAA